MWKMSYSSEDETDISDSELDEYVDRCYEQLRVESHKVKFSTELFRCPFCPGKKKLVYAFKDLLQHASDVGKGSQNRDIKHKGKHLGLVKYMKNDLDQEGLALELAGLTVEPSPKDGVSVLFVWPWMGVVANLDGESISKLKTDLAKRGFDPARIRPLSDGRYAVVEFKRDWSGFYNAVMFEKEFEVGHHGKKDYLAASHSDGMYGWVARADDYNAEGFLGEYLQKNGDLKTIGDVEAEGRRKTSLLVAHLGSTIEELRVQVEKNGCLDKKVEGNCTEP
ncbi:hypothetical protein SASPL_120198 [Salvia splendens]|uniref:XS domain-containing protein n=2 Tax=Salvia splendens TaxID=180675 RepID=A0A8X8XQ20_SALSN|nr:hypothetical protein SASPL_120198 [Salvia splendens]